MTKGQLRDELRAAMLDVYDEEIDGVIDDLGGELDAGLRGSAVDPPFAALIKRAEALNHGNADDGKRTALAKRLDEALNTIEMEIRELAEGIGEWTQHIADYGFSTPESYVARCVVAAVEPDLRKAAPTFQTVRELGEWLLENPVSFRVIHRAEQWATCTFHSVEVSPVKAKAIQRRFLRQVFASIREEVRNMDRSADYWERSE